MTDKERTAVEQEVSAKVADQLMLLLPQDDQQRRELLESGRRLAAKMGWDTVIERQLAPLLDRVAAG